MKAFCFYVHGGDGGVHRGDEMKFTVDEIGCFVQCFDFEVIEYFGEGFFLFCFTPNALVHSGLRGLGEEVKAINENLLTCKCVRAYAYARNAR